MVTFGPSSLHSAPSSSPSIPTSRIPTTLPHQSCHLSSSPINLVTTLASFQFPSLTRAELNWHYGPHIGHYFQYNVTPPSAWSPFTARGGAWGHSGINYRRWAATPYSAPVWKRTAWHLTNFFDVDRLVNKLRRFSHAHDKSKANRVLLLDPRRVAQAIQNCTDVFESGKYPDMQLWTPPPADPLLEFIRAHFNEFWPTGIRRQLGATAMAVPTYHYLHTRSGLP